MITYFGGIVKSDFGYFGRVLFGYECGIDETVFKINQAKVKNPLDKPKGI
jgi:hypothetical protein